MSPIWKIIALTICLNVIPSFAMEDWEKWPLSELEQQMSPSRWNPNKSPDEVIKEYVDVSIRETQKAQTNLRHELGISYGNKPTQAYDIYGTDLPENAPIYFWIHGGYWQEGSKDISGLMAENLYGKGIRNIVLGYTLAPNATVQEIEHETMMALNHAMKKFPNAKITVGGHSAGGQLSAMLLHSPTHFPDIYKQLAGLVLVSGVYDLRLLVPTYVNNLLKMTPDSAKASSPLQIGTFNAAFREKSSNFPILITVGNYDSPEFQRQAEEYYKLLKATFPKTELWKSPSDDHFTLVQNMGNPAAQAGKEFVQFMDNFTDDSKNGGAASMSMVSGTITAALTSILLLAL